MKMRCLNLRWLCPKPWCEPGLFGRKVYPNHKKSLVMTQGSLPLEMEKKGHKTFRSDSWEGMLSDLSLEGLACEFLAVEGSSKSRSARYGYQRKESSTKGLLDILDLLRGGWSTDPSSHPRICVPIEVPDPIGIPTGLWPLPHPTV